MVTNVASAGVAILALIAFLYSMFVIMRQKRMSELQKDFINNMTHEFKTPISSINIAAGVLNQDNHISRDKRLSKYTQVIKDQNDRLNRQVEKVLNVAKLESETFKLKKEDIDLIPLIKGIVDAEQIKLKEGQIFFSTDKVSATAFADRLHFTNVIHNIIDNGVKYCHNIPQINISLSTHNDQTIIRIQDNGIGIDKENQKLIFNKFYRVSTGNIHDVKGFGLGLFYVNHVIKAHGWQINVEGSKKTGTTFKISIPTSKT